jgi:hypothetical protein
MADDATLAFVRSLGRQLPRTAAPEGWVKRIDRRRVGRVWVGFFHLWTTDADGRRVRKFKEKTLGPASMPKHDAQKKLADYIEEYTGRLTALKIVAGVVLLWTLQNQPAVFECTRKLFSFVQRRPSVRSTAEA